MKKTNSFEISFQLLRRENVIIAYSVRIGWDEWTNTNVTNVQYKCDKCCSN